jgi:hypothetical protein
VGGALLATAWNGAGLLAVNLVAVEAGWWRFGVEAGAVAGVPADLWLGWALLWGAVPVLATTRWPAVVAALLVAVDLVLMPLAEPVVDLGPTWPIGEAVAVAACLVPGMLLGRWTATATRLAARVALQVVGFAGLVYFVLPTLLFAASCGGWGPLLARPAWQLARSRPRPRPGRGGGPLGGARVRRPRRHAPPPRPARAAGHHWALRPRRQPDAAHRHGAAGRLGHPVGQPRPWSPPPAWPPRSPPASPPGRRTPSSTGGSAPSGGASAGASGSGCRRGAGSAPRAADES